jgi:hypothetical protein
MKKMVWVVLLAIGGMIQAWGQADLFITSGTTITNTLPLVGTAEIPSQINGVTITQIGPPLINQNGWVHFGTMFDYGLLTNLIVSASITNIGKASFGGATNLQNIYFLGNAPTVGIGAFNRGTFYYLPGTAGWETNSGRKAQPWLPSIQLAETNHNAVCVNWARGQSVVVEASASLAGSAWMPVVTNTIPDAPLLTNCLPAASFTFCDSDQTNHPAWYYRVRSF